VQSALCTLFVVFASGNSFDVRQLPALIEDGLFRAAPAGMEPNWIPTAGKEPYLWLRLYGPDEGFWNKTFKMPDVELVN